MDKITVLKTDITKIVVDAIVNAANKSLLGGGGVDGAIHFAAGKELLKECLLLGGCEVGKAKITKGYDLPAKYIIHTVGPVYGHEDGKESDILKNCYINSFELAKKYNFRSIAFPCIGTGCFMYPKDEAAEIAIQIARKYLKDFDKIIFVCYSELDYNIYNRILKTKK